MIRTSILALVVGLSTAAAATAANPYGWAQPGFPRNYPTYPGYQPGFGDEAQYIRSLYLRYLNREPEPLGMRSWLNRLAFYQGDRQRLEHEFLRAAQAEVESNTPSYYPGFGNPFGR